VNLGPGTYTIVFEHTVNGAIRPPKRDGGGTMRARGRVRVVAE
jgi:hypothetical protein